MVSRDYMNDSDFEEHKRGTIRSRKKSAIIQYAIIGVLYLGLAYFCFNAPNLWEKLTKPEAEKDSWKTHRILKIMVHILREVKMETTIFWRMWELTMVIPR